MAIKIVRYPDPILFEVAKPVILETEASKLVHELYKAMIAIKWGRPLGLAAPQIGISKRLFMIGMRAFINPEIISLRGSYKTHEGCYSLKPNCFDYPVDRPDMVTLRWTDVNGNRITDTFEGGKAQVICHEFDHLQGKLLVPAPVEVTQ